MSKVYYRIFVGVSIASVILYMFGFVSQNLMFLILGSSCIVAAIYLFISKRNILNYGEYADARVVESIHRRGRRGGTYIPVLEYEVGGEVHRVQYSVGNANAKYKDGEMVKIIYNRENVENVVIEGDNTKYVVSVVFGIFGVVMLGLSLFMNFIG